MDPYQITPSERARFEQQFNSLNPINGIVTGDQAKGFLLQSQLPPATLGIIWALADTDADGKMNINEFSIACKLINLKLRGFEIPKALPPSLLALANQPVKPPIPPLPSSVPPMASTPLVANLTGGSSSSIPPVSVQPMMASRIISPPSGGQSPLQVTAPPPIPPLPAQLTGGKDEKVKELSKQISETRCGVTSVKSIIDGMRSTRDQNLAEYNRLKALLKQRNQQVNSKMKDVENNNSQLDTLRKQLSGILDECEELYNIYAGKRNKMLELKGANDVGNDVWGNSSWDTAPAQAWPEDQAATDRPGYTKYRALYEFSSRNPDELSFQPGDIIYVLTNQQAEPGWLSGELRGNSGWFPESYVEPMDNANVDNGFANTTALPKTPLELKVNLKLKLKVYLKLKLEVKLKLNVELKVKLTITQFQSHTQTETKTRSQIETQSHSQIQTQTETSSQSHTETKTPSQTETQIHGKPKKPVIATVIAPYQATSTEQLSLQRGQLIMIRKKTSTGWWEGELQAKGKKRQIGWFPASYVKLLAGGRLSQSQSRKTSESGLSDGLLERVIALYPYVAQNEDELSFEKDDIVTILAKDEPSWWKGECKGGVGVFPSNYVGPMYEAPSPTVTDVSPSPVAELNRNHRNSSSSSTSSIEPNFQQSKGSEKKRQQAIKELIQTEQAYIDDMSIVHELPRMTVYIRFCSCQLRAAALLQHLTTTKPEFLELSKKCQSDPRTQGLPLSSFLIKPMQRITKYPLLISKPLLLSETTITVDGLPKSEIKLDHNKIVFHLRANSEHDRDLWLSKLVCAQRDMRKHELEKFTRQQSSKYPQVITRIVTSGCIPAPVLATFLAGTCLTEIFVLEQASFGAVGRILVMVLSGSNLKPRSADREVFCEVSMGAQEHRTPTVHMSSQTEVVFNASLQFLVKDLNEDPHEVQNIIKLSQKFKHQSFQKQWHHLFDIDISTQEFSQRCDAFAFDTARYNMFEPSEVRVTVYGDTMCRHVTARVDADGAKFLFTDPYPRIRMVPVGGHGQRRAQSDDGVFEILHVPFHARFPQP
ncbi:unnamed protein product [Nesidiocoris tenuis]|uniref:Intersectin-1 n=1 Tax=Nesidiocoris tenuis TaxID=355587 RepID=A0A6H5G1Q5_9HEMI|nr:unnamed protein product [Nesidiocoris tenuis]